jgi:hypothetical protein
MAVLVYKEYKDRLAVAAAAEAVGYQPPFLCRMVVELIS